MLSALLLVTLMFVAGAAFARMGIFPDSGADVLNRFVVYVSLPALVLCTVPQLSWEPELLLLVVIPWGTLVLGALAVWLCARLLHWPRQVLGALLLCVPLGNTSFLGLPLIAALRGQEAVRYALVYDQFGSFLILSTYGLFVLARFSGDRAPTLAEVGLRVLGFPPFIALIAAFIPWPHPPVLDEVLQRIGDTLAPIAMFAVGMRLRLRPPPERSALVLGLTIKLALMPLCALLLVRALGSESLAAEVAVLEAAMPAMLTAAALASLAGLAPELCAALAAYGIVLAFMTVPLWAAVF
jgi:malate permease and related proteins